MKRTIILLLSILCISGLQAQKKALDLKEITDGKFRPETVYGITSMNDGEHYTRMNAEGTKIIKYAYRTGEEVGVLFDVTTARNCDFKRFDGYTFSPDETKILIRTQTVPKYRRSYTAIHHIYTIKNNILEPLSDGGPQEAPVFSPDGTMIAFVREGNIFLIKMLYNNSESQITEDGKFNAIINGLPDWVYEEEFGFSRALEFDPTSQMIAYIRFDETKVPLFSFQLYAGEAPRLNRFDTYPGTYDYKYPKTGENNSTVTVHAFDIKSRVTRKMDLPLDADGYIPRIKFTNDPAKLAIVTLNRHQNRLDLYFADPRSTVCKHIMRDESAYYISEDALNSIRFYPNNFSYISEKSGFAHLYWYSIGGNLIKQVTQGDYEVKDFIGWDEGSDTFYFESNEESPLCNAVYKIDKKGKKSKLSEQRGTNSALFSSTFKYYINTYSSLNTPPLITINDNSGKALKTITDNAGLRQTLAGYALPSKEFFTFTTSEGISLNGWIMKPHDFNPNKKYPALMFQYSGPASQQVLDRWNIGGGGGGVGWESYMTAKGYVIVCVDGRGTGGRGEEFTKCTYLNLGVKEARDQVETAMHLASLPYIEKSRIGIWGWSYGGYMTIMSMSEGRPVFKAGAAVAPVTAWKYYDTIYGERFMRTPKENAEGYKAGSAFERAAQLNGRLLLVHGTADDNVHVQNVMEYSECLVQANKQFEMQLYTNRNHGIYGGNTRYHLFTRLTDFFIQNL